MFLTRTEAEKAQRRARKELERVAKAQRKHAAQEHKAQVGACQAATKGRHTTAKGGSEKTSEGRPRGETSRQDTQSRGSEDGTRAGTTGTFPLDRSRAALCKEKRLSRLWEDVQLDTLSPSSSLSAMPRKRSVSCVPRSYLTRNDHVNQWKPWLPLQRVAQRRDVHIQLLCHLLVWRSQCHRHVVDVQRAGAPCSGRSRSDRFFKKKKSAEQLRNRTMDFNLQIDKQTMFSGRSIELQSQPIVPT
ncbi:unnamed protein product [Peronospora destructor]|uniref:Uncharacterized protein n=1 Tax=Peronospora destructor TaxID=86335 RepID=A0AAV0TR47_9STRA|nr:unnamed protein product [Peronospora destructor]